MLRSRGANRVEAGLRVTRRRRRVSRVRLGVAGRGRYRLRIVALGATALVLAGAGVTYASTKVFGHNQVGTQYANGIQVSDDQIIKPLGDRLLTQFGKFMGSTVSPDGRFLAATSADKSVVLQIFDLSSYKLIWTVGSASAVNQKLTDGTVGQVGPTYSPDGKFLWLPEQNGLSRFPVNADGTLGTPTTVSIPVRERPLRPGGTDHVLARRVHAVRSDQRTEHCRRARPQHRCDRAHVERRHRPA